MHGALQITMGVYVSSIAIYGRRVDSAVAAATTAFQSLNAQSCNLYNVSGPTLYSVSPL